MTCGHAGSRPTWFKRKTLCQNKTSNLTSIIHNYSGIKGDRNAKLSYLTILPLGVLKGHAEEYSKLVLGSITGCSPMTPTPLQKT